MRSRKSDTYSRPEVSFKGKEGNTLLYKIEWSTLFPLDRYTVRAVLPSESGLFKLYAPDKRGNMVCFAVDQAYHGGVRNSLQELLDGDAMSRPAYKDHALALKGKGYVRYTLCSSMNELQNVLCYLKDKPNEAGQDIRAKEFVED